MSKKWKYLIYANAAMAGAIVGICVYLRKRKREDTVVSIYSDEAEYREKDFGIGEPEEPFN